ncbi:MAG: RDD family protein [Polaromonas sp.]|nr:RDD family protein [Polaromonas sp.]
MVSPPQLTAPIALIFAPSIWRRMACWLYEGMLLFGVIFIAGYLFGTMTQTRHALDNRPGLQLFVFLTSGVYFVWFWARGQTLAMKTWHIRVVGVHGQPLTRQRAALRYLLSWMWFLPPLATTWLAGLSAPAGAALAFGWIVVWALSSRLNSERQFWHDIWAGTRLITWITPPRKTAGAPSDASGNQAPRS